MSKKLKACPHCGADAEMKPEWFVECQGCLAEGPLCDTQEEAADAWNLRWNGPPGIGVGVTPTAAQMSDGELVARALVFQLNDVQKAVAEENATELLGELSRRAAARSAT